MIGKPTPSHKKESRRRSVFITLLTSYIIILLFPAVIGSVLYSQVAKLMVENANRTNLGMLEQVKRIMDSRLGEIDAMTVQIGLNPRLAWLMNNMGENKLEDQMRVMELMTELRSFRNINSFTNDFYLYLNNSDTIITPYMKTNSEIFFERIQVYKNKESDWVRSTMLSGPHYKTFFPLASIQDSGSLKQSNIITYVQGLPLEGLAQPDGYLIFNIDEVEFNQMLRQVEWVSQGDIYILNDEQEILISNSSDQLLDPALYAELSGSSNYHRIQHGGEEKMLSFTTSSYGWKYVSLVPTDIVLSKVNGIKNWAVTLLILYLAGGVVAAYFLAYRNYSPIREVVLAITKGKGLTGPSQANEYEFIKKTIVSAMDEEKNLRKTLSEQAPVIQANFLSRLIKGYVDVDTSDGHDRSLAFMGIQFPHGYFGTIIIDIEDCSGFAHGETTEQEWALARFVISNVGNDLLHNQGYIIEMDRSRLAVLLNIEDPEAGGRRRDEFIYELKRITEDKFKLKTTMAVSMIHKGMKELGRGYREALIALDYRIIQGSNEIIFYEQMEDLEQHYYHYPMETETQLINYAKSGDYEQAEKLLEQIYETNFVIHGITPEMGRCLFFDLLSTVLKVLNGMNLEDAQLFEGASDPAKYISDCSTAEEMLVKTKRLYSKICSRTKEDRTDHGERLFMRITNYIETHGFDGNLSLTTMADHFSLTPQYLSAFFKKHGGINITDYIAKVRIRESKRLLADRKLTISQIALKIGYSNDVGFIRFFKKYEGITPGKYRETLEE